VQRLKTEFIPYAGERNFLERRVGSWWMPVVQSANPRHQSGQTTQGSYVIGADGTAYAWDNFNQPGDRFGMLLDRGLAAFKARPSGPVRVDTSFAQSCKPPAIPSDVSVVSIYTRIRPLPSGAASQNANIGREYLWIYKDEVRQMLQGKGTFAMPRSLAARIVLYGIIDNVRGQVVPWQPRDVSKIEFTVTAQPTYSRAARFKFSGSFAKRGTTPFFTDRGHEGKIEGTFEVDQATEVVTKFRAYSEGVAWGVAPHARPDVPPAGKYPLVVAMVEAQDRTMCVWPATAMIGDGYRNPRL
jgi:hypothetical protein